MRFIKKLQAVTFCLLLVAGNADAEEKKQLSPITEAFMLGCLPFALNIMTFAPDAREVLNEAGLVPSNDLPPEVIRRLSSGKYYEGAVSKAMPKNIFLAGVRENLVCRVGVFDVSAIEYKKEIDSYVKQEPWKYLETTSKGGVKFESYEWVTPGKPRLIAIVSAAEIPPVDTSGLQLMVTVAPVKD